MSAHRPALAAILLLLAVAACGGRDEAAERRDCEEGFVKGFVESFGETTGAQVAAPEDAVRESARRFCEQAVGTLDPDSEDFEEEAVALILEHPQIMRPVCIGSAQAGLDAFAPELASPEVRAATETYASDMCDLAISENLFSAQGAPSQEELDRLYAEHPEIVVPLCVAGGMVGYDSEPLVVRGREVTRRRAEAFLERFCEEAIVTGTFGPSSDPTPTEQAQSEEIAARVLAEMIAAGELP
jgi:hypothetical protein